VSVIYLTVKVSCDGVGSTLPVASMARTQNVCWPRCNLVVVAGDVQDRQAPLSTRHEKCEPASVEMNRKVGVRSLILPWFLDVSLVLGGVRSGGGEIVKVVLIVLAALSMGSLYQTFEAQAWPSLALNLLLAATLSLLLTPTSKAFFRVARAHTPTS